MPLINSLILCCKRKVQIYLILIALSALIIISAEKLGLCFPCATPYITRAWCEHNDLACKKKRKRGVLTRSHVPRGVAGKGQQMSLRMTHVGVVVPRNEIVSRWWCRCARRVVSCRENVTRGVYVLAEGLSGLAERVLAQVHAGRSRFVLASPSRAILE